MTIQSSLNEQALLHVYTAVHNYRRLSAAHPAWVGRMNSMAVDKFNNTRVPFDSMTEAQRENFKSNFNVWVANKVNELAGACVGYVYTNGLKPIEDKALLKICFAKHENNVVIATVESARTGATLHKFGQYVMSRDALRDMPEDPYDSMVFNRAAFALFGLSI